MSRNSDIEETEEDINQSLTELGLLEEGMTFNDKKSLWSVIKLSKDTAQAEEQDRQKRAKKSLQFDEITSRSEIPSNSKENEESSGSSTEELNVIYQNVKEVPESPLRFETSQKLGKARAGSHTYSPVNELLQSNKLHSSSVSSSQTSIVSSHSVTASSSTAKSDKEDLLTLSEIVQPTLQKELKSSQLSQSETKKFHFRKKSNLLADDNETSSQNRFKLSFVSNNEVSDETNLELNDFSTKGSKSTSLKNNESDTESITQEKENAECGDLSPIRRIVNKTSISMLSTQNEEIFDKCEIEGDNSALEKQSESDIENERCNSADVPSPASDSLLNDPASGQDIIQNATKDRRKDIDAFNCDRSNYEWTLKVRKEKRIFSRLPFYIPPYKMDIHTYIAYFKKCINEQATRLIEVQRRHRKYVTWGEPILEGKEEEKETPKSNLSLQRYNLRRKELHPKVSTIYEDPNNDNDEDIFNTKPESPDDLFDSLLADRNNKKELVETATHSKDTSQQENVKIYQTPKPKDSDDDMFDSENDDSDNLLTSITKVGKEDKEQVPTESVSSCIDSTTTEKQVSMKRKSDSSDDQIVDPEDKSSEPEEKRAATTGWLSVKKEGLSTAVKRKKLGPVISDADCWKDLNNERVGDEEKPNNRLTQKQSGRVTRNAGKYNRGGKAANTDAKEKICDTGPVSSWKELDINEIEDYKPPQKVYRKRGAKLTKGEGKSTNKDEIKMKDGMEDESDIFEGMHKTDTNGGKNSKLQTPVDVIRPAPLKLRRQVRRKNMVGYEAAQNTEEIKTNTSTANATTTVTATATATTTTATATITTTTTSEKAEAIPMDDIQVVFDGASTSTKTEKSDDYVPCPICSKKFPAKDIEAHASECNEYCQEEIPDEELHISPASSPEDLMQQQNSSSVMSNSLVRRSGRKLARDSPPLNWTEYKNKKELKNEKVQQQQQHADNAAHSQQGTAATKITSD